MKNDSLTPTYLALTAALTTWGISFVASKIALESFTVYTLLATRFGLVSCIFLGIMCIRGFPHFTRREHGALLLTALFQPGLYFYFETLGLSLTTASKSSLITATIPLVVLSISVALGMERLRPAGLVGIVISLVGVAMLVMGGRDFSWSGGNLMGDAFMFCAVLSAAAYMLLARSLGKKHSAFEITSMQMLYGTVLFIPLMLSNMDQMIMPTLSIQSVGAVFFLAVVCTIGAFFCYNYALANIPASQASMFMNGVPVVTAITAWAVLGEVLTPVQGIGGALVLAAVYLSNRTTSAPVHDVPTKEPAAS